MGPSKPALDDLRIERSGKTDSPTRIWPVILVVFVLALLAGGTWWWSRPKVLEVRTVPVRQTSSGTAERTVLNASGYVTARRAATVSSKVTGKVVEVLIEEGLKVKEGQVLARLDNTNVKASLRLAEAQLRLSSLASTISGAAEADLEFASEASSTTMALYVVKDVIPAASVGIVYGVTGSGKTFWLLDGGFCICLGKSFMGRRTRRGAVLYVALEGRTGFNNRVAAAMGVHGDPGVYFARFKNLVRLGRSPEADADVTRIVAAAGALAKQSGTHVALIVVDTLPRALAGDNENDSAAISAVVAQANRIAAETGAAVLFAHHPGKDHERGMRGSSALAADFDTVIKIDRQPGASNRQVILEKAKDGEEGPLGSFTLERVALGRDDDGDEITSCVVKFGAAHAAREPRQPASGSAAAAALNELDHLVIAGSARPSSGHDRIPDGAALVLKNDWRQACRAKQLSEGDPASEKKAFQRAVVTLDRLGCIGQHGDFVWRIKNHEGTGDRGDTGGHVPTGEGNEGPGDMGHNPIRGVPMSPVPLPTSRLGEKS